MNALSWATLYVFLCVCCVLTCSAHSADSDYGDQECGWYVAHIQASDHVSIETPASFYHALMQVSFLFLFRKMERHVSTAQNAQKSTYVSSAPLIYIGSYL